MLEKVREDLRIKHNSLDNSIQGDIDACKVDLELAGVYNINVRDPLVQKAICLYCRWQINYEDAAERYQKAYESLKMSLALCGDYNGGDNYV